MYGARAHGLLAAGLFAANHLHMAYGGAELPRVVASTFALLAFAALRGPAVFHVLAGGLLLGVAASLRFGEVVFFVPAVYLQARQHPLRAVLLAVGGASAMAILLGAADAWYWGDAFHSVRAIVDYTLVHGRSSRGFEPPAYYLTHIPAWSDFLLCGLAACAFRTAGRSALLWAALPIALLSLLPHKEPRYVIVTIPFLALAASGTLRVWIQRLATSELGNRHQRLARFALVLLLAAGGSLLFNVSKFRFNRSEDAVRLGWQLRDAGVTGLAAEQLWRFGGRLYLHETPALIDLDPELPAADPHFAKSVCRDEVTWVALRRDRIAQDKRERLHACGFIETLLMPPDRTGYVTFARPRLGGRSR
jgi:hypothetical protein